MSKAPVWINWLTEPQIGSGHKPRHSGCLSIWLAFAILGSVLFFIITFTRLSIPTNFFLHYTPPKIKTNVYGFDLLNVAIYLLTLIGAIGILLWKKWGYYLSLVMYVLGFALDVITQLPQIVNHYSYNISYLLGLAIFYLLIRQELKLLKQTEIPPATEEGANQTN